MAKNFFETIEDGMLEVDHCGEKVTLNLPEWLIEAKGILEDESELVRWANEHEIMHGLIHNGIQKLLIDLRASARPRGKDAKERSIKNEIEKAQANVNEFVLAPVKRPGQSKKAEREAIELETLKATISGMRAAGIDDETIRTILGAQFEGGLIDRALKG